MREIKFRAWHRREKRMMPRREISQYYLGAVVAQKHADFMQYTDLKDKTGTEIYEGDILGGANNPALVQYDESSACFVFTRSIEPDAQTVAMGRTREQRKRQQGKLHVIGNVYENPELLEN